MSDLIENKKSSFSKPENWVQWIVTGVIIYGTGFLLYKGLPYVNDIISNLWYTIAAGLPLAFICYLLVSKDIHKLVWYGYKSALRWITGRFIELDPIGIMKTYIEYYSDLIEEVRGYVASMRAQLANLNKLIKDANDDAQHSLALASQAKALISQNPSMQQKAALEARKAEGLQESSQKYAAMRDMVQKYLDIATKMLEKANINKADLESTVDRKSKEREAIKATYKAMAGFKHLLQGDKELETFNMALEAETNFEFQKIGEMEQFTEDMKDIMQTADLEKRASEASSLAKLDEWEKKSNKNVRIASNIVLTPQLNTNSSESFDDLFDSDDTHKSNHMRA